MLIEDVEAPLGVVSNRLRSILFSLLKYCISKNNSEQNVHRIESFAFNNTFLSKFFKN